MRIDSRYSESFFQREIEEGDCDSDSGDLFDLAKSFYCQY